MARDEHERHEKQDSTTTQHTPGRGASAVCPRVDARRPRPASQPASSPSAGLAAAPAGASSQPTTVKAVETDFHIAFSKKTFAPGKYTFEAINKGHTTHALQITGPGLKNAVDQGPLARARARSSQ